VKKAFGIIKNIIVWAVVALAVSMMLFTIISVNTFNRNDRELFGYKLYIVFSDSMAKTDFDAGDLILVKETDPTTLQPGDIITYMSQNSENYGQVVTHKIRRLVRDAQGNPGFVTYGTTTDVDDETIVTYPYILGKHEGTIPKVGTFFNFLKTPQGYFLCIFLPFMLLILYEGVNRIQLFRRYKKEQSEEMEAEKARLDAERAENAKMLEELRALKEELESSKSASTAQSAEEAQAEAAASKEEI